ncbi:MAG: F0F1 ATP synthase subunit B [Lachnospiraceae bacterium]|nr:F0F1 ATP synthase subunit B [Lachnospiraceae bacterium]
MSGRVFGLDSQFLFDALIMAVAMLVLFTLLSYILFNPVRELLKKRKEYVEGNINAALSDKEEAAKLKEEYDNKLANVEKEADEILSDTRKKAIKRENEIVDEAKAEANRIISRANKEAELEKSKVKDEVKQEIISVAKEMAGKLVEVSIDEKKQMSLIDETLEEMGEGTWQN